MIFKKRIRIFIEFLNYRLVCLFNTATTNDHGYPSTPTQNAI